MATQWRYVLPAPVRRLPADLVAVIGWTALTVLVVWAPVIRETPLRVAFGLPFLLFLPGYAFVALLFPEAGAAPAGLEDDGREFAGGVGDSSESAGGLADSSAGDGVASDSVFADGQADGQSSTASPGDSVGASPGDSAGASPGQHAGASPGKRAGTSPGEDRGIDGIERVALSFGLSIAIVPLLGLALNFTPWGIRLWPVLLAVSGFTLVCAAGAAQRRWLLPPAERFFVPYRTWVAQARSEAFEPEDRVDGALNVVLAVSILLAVGSVGYAIAVPPDGEQFTELYVLTDGGDEELVAADYPEDLVEGESTPLVLGIGNQEHEPVDYTVVAQLQRVETADNVTTVVERRELDRYETSLAHNETWHHRHDVTPTMTGEELRLQYLLYRGAPPSEPTAENAYRDVHLWVDVVE